MTHVCCPSCGLRFTGAVAVHLTVCPECGGPPQAMPSAEHLLGYRLASDIADSEFQQAIAVAVALPGSTGRPS